MNARNAASDHEHVRMDGKLGRRQRLDGTGPGEWRLGRAALALAVASCAIGMHPGVVLADVDHLEVEGVEAALFDGVAEGVFVQQRRAGGDDDPIQTMFADVLLDEFLAGIRAHVLVVSGEDDAGEPGHVSGHGRAIDRFRRCCGRNGKCKSRCARWPLPDAGVHTLLASRQCWFPSSGAPPSARSCG